MRELLLLFWEWLNLSEEQYIYRSDIGQEFEEYMFPQWDELLKETEMEIYSSIIDQESMEYILIIMALDNENEDVLDYIVKYATDDYIESLVHFGMESKYHHVRWQIVELLARRRPSNWIDLVKQLCNDKNAYVSKRAKSVLFVDMLAEFEY